MSGTVYLLSEVKKSIKLKTIGGKPIQRGRIKEIQKGRGFMTKALHIKGRGDKNLCTHATKAPQ